MVFNILRFILYHLFFILNQLKNNNFLNIIKFFLISYIIKLGIGDWGLGIGD